MFNWHASLSPFGSWHNGENPFSPSGLLVNSTAFVWYDPSDVANTLWRRNLLTFTEQFNNAAWTAGAVNLASFSAGRITPNTTLGQHRLDRATTIQAAAHTFSLEIKPDGYDFIWLRLGLVGAVFNATTGVATNVSAGVTASSSPASDGYFRVSISVVTSANDTIRINASSTTTSADFAGDGTSGVLIRNAQLELGSTATEYQRITDVNTEVRERFPTATLYQDAAGTTPVTAPAQPVGLVLDKSRGLVVGPELVTNGDFSAGSTGWTVPVGWSITGGAAVATAASGSLRGGGVTPILGRGYQVEFDVVSYTSGILYITVGGNFTGQVSLTGSGMSPGRKSIFVLSGSDAARGVEFYGGAVSATIDNISVRELPGFHATQSTAANRPTYGVVPSRGRVNLLTGVTVNPTDTSALTLFGDAAATLTVVDDPAALAAAGLSSIASNGKVFRLNNTAGTSNAFVRFNNSLTMGADTWSLSAYVRGSGTSVIDVNAGTWSGGGSTVLTSAYQRQVSTGVTNTSNNQWRIRVGAGGDVYFILMQAELGSSAAPYQSAVNAFNVTDPVGFPSYPCHYLSFDGVDDFMVTPTITPNADKVQVFAGVRKLSDAATGIVVELSTNSTSTVGSFGVLAPSALLNDFQFRSGGSISGVAATAAGFSSPITRILTGLGDISGDLSTLRVNGSQAAQNTANQGTGNYLAYPLYIGRRAGTSLPFNGQLFSLIVRFSTANLDAGLISQTERWVGGKTGVTI